jgi:hypothetical protein
VNNSFNVDGSGIRCAVDGAWIENNKLVSGKPWGREKVGSIGIALTAGFDASGIDQCQVLANQVSGFSEAGILVDAPVTDLIVKLNIIEQCGSGIVVRPGKGESRLSIENNHLREIGPRANDASGLKAVFGIMAQRATTAAIRGNTIHLVGVNVSATQRIVAGIAAAGVRSTQVVGNELTGVAASVQLPVEQAAGVLLRGPYERAEIAGNRVERDLAPQADATPWQALTTDEPSAKRPFVRATDYAAIHVDDARALVLLGDHAYVSSFGIANAAVARRGSSVVVRGNTAMGRAEAPTVQITAGFDIQFCDNHCEAPGARQPTVLLRSDVAVINANVILGGENSLVSEADLKRTTLMGNATTGGIAINGHPPEDPWKALNIRI